MSDMLQLVVEIADIQASMNCSVAYLDDKLKHVGHQAYLTTQKEM
ncbi:MAG TPA: hypothetical protein VF074_00645 [Pyrinomonadaceae bacterium]